MPDRQEIGIIGAGGGGRTLMTSEGRGILSPVRLPVPPLQQLFDYFEFITFRARRTVVVSVVVLGNHSTALGFGHDPTARRLRGIFP